MVQALKMLMLGRPGLTWSSEAPSEVSDLVVAMTDNLMEAGHLTERILSLLTSLDWTSDLAGLQRSAALGDPQHVSTIQLLHADRTWQTSSTATRPSLASVRGQQSN